MRVVKLRPEKREKAVASLKPRRRGEIYEQREAFGLREYARELSSLSVVKLDRAQNAEANHSPNGGEKSFSVP
jgi:hypothetical protein